MSQSNNDNQENNDGTFIGAIDTIVYLIVSRFLIIMLPIIIIIGLVRYQSTQAVYCGGKYDNNMADSIKISVIGFTILISRNGQLSITSGNFAVSDCVGAKLASRNLSGADLNYANLVEADLQFSNLSNAQLYGANLSGANLAGANLQGANLGNAKLVGANLNGADLRNASLENTDLRGADLPWADLTKADLTTSKLAGVNFQDAKLVQVDLHRVNLAGIGLPHANLTGANLDGANLNGTSISGANFSGVSAIKTQLSGIWANRTNLTGANLTQASLAGSILIGSNLTSANLTQANLASSVLVAARLNGANLSGANVTDVRLFLAELDQTFLEIDPVLSTLNELQRQELLKNADLSGITFDTATIWPAGKMTLLASILGPRLNSMAANTTPKESDTEEPLVEEDTGQVKLPVIPLTTNVTGTLFINGSSSVYPLTTAMGDSFLTEGFSGSIKIGQLGTGAGFTHFCGRDSEIKVDIVNASRLMNDSELELCNKNGLNPISFTVALDAFALVTNPINEAVNNVTSEQLPLLFTAETWAVIDNAWPSKPILRFSGAPGSGVDFIVDKLFDGNIEALINAPNITFGSSSDIVLGVTSNEYALGFVAYNFYSQNSQTMKLLSIDDDFPSPTAVTENGTYPLIRPLYIYTDASILKENIEVRAFITFYLTHINRIAEETGYFAAPDTIKDQDKQNLLTILN